MATKGNWYVDGRFIRTDAQKIKIIAEIPEGGIVHGKIDKANAERICQCVNNFDDLVNACEKAKNTIYDVMNKRRVKSLSSVWRELDQTIKKAKGGK